MVPGRAIADFADKPFQLRLLLSLDRSSNFSDAAARQASIAFPAGSSGNPAADDWRPRDALHPTVSVTNIQAFSESGAWVVATAVTANVVLPEAGTLSAAYARTDTIDRKTRQDLSFDLRSNEFFVAYSQRLSDNTALGGELRLTDSVLKEQFLEPIAGLPLESKVKSTAIDAALGLLAQPRPGWFAGMVASIGWAGANIDIRNLVPLPTPTFGTLPAGTKLDRFSDDIRFLGLRAGVGYAPSSTYGIYVDAQYLTAHSNRAGSAKVGRVVAGLDFQPTSSVVLRTGLGIDTEDEVTLSIGAGYYGFKKVAIDLAYQYNAQPELRREFGRFDLLSASLSFPF